MARLKSPNYPSIGLPAAIEKIRAVYEREHTNPAPRTVIADALGYAGISGRSATIIGALRQFELLTGRGDELRVSDLALTLMHAPEDSDEYNSALKEAAFSPSLFSMIREQFSGKIPSDANLRFFLVKNRFSQRAQKRIHRSLRETMELLSEKGVDSATEDVLYAPGSGKAKDDDGNFTPELPAFAPSAVRPKEVSKSGADTKTSESYVERTILTEGVAVEIRFTAKPSYEDFEALSDYVEFRKKRLRRTS